MRAPSSGDSDPTFPEAQAGQSAKDSVPLTRTESDPNPERHSALRQRQQLEARLLEAEAELHSQLAERELQSPSSNSR